mgnify:FL=1
MSKKNKKTEMAQNEFILSLTTAIGDLETRLQACEQIQATLQAQCNELRAKNEKLRERVDFLDIENQTLAMIIEKRFNKLAEGATSALNIVTKNLEPR